MRACGTTLVRPHMHVQGLGHIPTPHHIEVMLVRCGIQGCHNSTIGPSSKQCFKLRVFVGVVCQHSMHAEVVGAVTHGVHTGYSISERQSA